MNLLNTFGFFLLHLIVLFIYRKYFRHIGLIHDIWFINLDRSTERREFMDAQLQRVSGDIPFHRWPATDGSKMTHKDYSALDIPAWSKPDFAKESRQKTRKGEIGCYLSHLELLRHLQSVPTPHEKGHLILEDDIILDPLFFKKVEKAAHYLPADWDILTFGVTVENNGRYKNINKRDIHHNIVRTKWMDGTYAYLVKHKSIPKILENTELIREPFDTTLGRLNKNKIINIYAYVPPIVRHRDNDDSTMSA